MPHFFSPGMFRPVGLGLAHRLGSGIGAAAAHLWHEAEYVNLRRAASSAPEKWAWVRRCLIASVLVVGEYVILSWLSPRLDSLLALFGSWLVLALLPKPTPRIPLLAARIYVLGTTSTSFGSVWIWAAARWTTLLAWENLFLLCWWGLSFTLLVWSFLALRLPRGFQTALTQSVAHPLQQFPDADPRKEYTTAHLGTSHSDVQASFEWASQTTRVKLSTAVRTSKTEATSRPRNHK